MKSGKLKIMITTGGVCSTLCVLCGNRRDIAVGQWLDVADVLADSEHAPCDRGRPGVSPPPAEIRRFFTERLERVPGAYVSMHDLREAFDDWPGNGEQSAEYSTFGRWARKVLPEGVRVERRVLNGERHNYVIGMRLRAI